MEPTPGRAAQRLSFETVDQDVAREQVARTFADHDLSVHSGPALDFSLDVGVGGGLSIGLMSYGANTTLEAPPMQSWYHVNLPLTGQGEVVQRGVRNLARAGEAGVVFLPEDPLAVSWSADQRQYTIQLRKERLESHAARLAGQPVQPIRFDLTFDLRSGAAQSLFATAGFVYAEMIRTDGIATMPAACYQLECALMTQLVMVVPSQLSRFLHGQATPVRRARIHELVEIIDTDPSPDLTTADLAARAGISLRSLQAGFQEVVGMSPSTYLRGARLDRVHAELLRGGRGTVTDVAMRWGFYHPGRFAQQYRERFGNLPSETAAQAPTVRSA